MIWKNRRFLSTVVVLGSLSILALSPFFWVYQHNIPLLSGGSEFFAYSWVYAVRWGAGERIFSPHMQLLFPIFAFINHAFNVTSGGFLDVIRGWHQVAFWWPLFLMLINLLFLFISIVRTHPTLDSVVASLLFLFSIPLFLGDSDINSTAYHSLGITIGLGSLVFWKVYDLNKTELQPLLFYVGLGIYTAICLLGKPTYVEFIMPFFVMEIVKALKFRRFRILASITISIASCLICTIAWLAWVYKDVAGLARFADLNRMFYTTQLHNFDTAKGSSLLDWYQQYVVGVMGVMPTLMIAVAVGTAALSRHRLVLLPGICFTLLFGLMVLYMRSQSHGHPEIMTLLLVTSLAAIRKSNVYSYFSSFFPDKTSNLLNMTASLAAVAAVFIFFPLPLLNAGYSEYMAENDAILVPKLLDPPDHARILALQTLPEVFAGVIDVWCLGSDNLVDMEHSYLIDNIFHKSTCLSFKQPDGIELRNYDRIAFQHKLNVTMADAIGALSKHFPRIFAVAKNCRPVERLPQDMVLNECDLGVP